jgi:hypothetical protein
LLSRINLTRPSKYYKGAGSCLKGPSGIEGKKGYPGKLTCVTMSNILTESDGLFQKIVKEVKKFPALTYEHYHVDDGDDTKRFSGR